MKQKKYWKGVEELSGDQSFVANQQNEFSEELPIAELGGEKLANSNAGRRDFLKMLGFSVTAAAAAASCEMPLRKAIPYVVKPEEVQPGVANYYASAYYNGGDYCGLLVKTMEGRPIKIEGNDLCPITQGGTSARVQASVLDLYDVSRAKGPHKGEEYVGWEKADAAIKKQLEAIAATGGQIRILSNTIISPSTHKTIATFVEKYPTTKHVSYDGMSSSGLLEASLEIGGEAVIPDYKFGDAEVIASFGADFLGTWISPVEYTKAYSKNRKVTADNPTMSRHYQVEDHLSVTGSNADVRTVVTPSQMGATVARLHNLIAKKAGSSTIGGVPAIETADEALKACADDLWEAKGKSLVVCGLNDKNVQLLVYKINDMLGNINRTVAFENYSMQRQGVDSDLADLVNEVNSGQVKALIVYNCNPVYNLAEGKAFGEALSKVTLSISFNDRIDETTSLCQYSLPDCHYLESWNDVEPKKDIIALAQPTINTIFENRQAQTSLLTWAGADTTDYYQFIMKNWNDEYFGSSGFGSFQEFWDQSAHDGLKSSSNALPNGNDTSAIARFAEAMGNAIGNAMISAQFNHIDINAVGSAIVSASKSGGELEVVFYEKVGLGDGSFANNPWLQEMPDPVSKVTWENYIMASREFVEENGLNYDPERKEAAVVDLTVNGNTVALPVVPMAGLLKNTIAVAVGYGRTHAGRAGNNVGQNVFPLIGNDRNYSATATISEAKITNYRIAQTQTHHSVTDDLGTTRPLVKETTLASYIQDKHAGNKDREFVLEHLTTIYPDVHNYEGRGHHWGLTVDLNSCTGCGACSVACQAENNVPVVGKEEVYRVHEMSWMRIDRYFSGDESNPSVIFQPLMCQHCDNAPCENVCPVAATNHSSEGINQMAYNRCVGTRYCANNCPYKVRRFNWYDYASTDSFEKGTIFDNETHPFTGKPYGVDGMLEDLTRMVLNPDVTVRCRGVMEKCSFCVHKIQAGKLVAKTEGRPLKDGDVKVACQAACPANAIAFGDTNDKNSEVYSWMEKNERAFKVIEEIHTLPSVAYLTKVRNVDEKQQA